MAESADLQVSPVWTGPQNPVQGRHTEVISPNAIRTGPTRDTGPILGPKQRYKDSPPEDVGYPVHYACQ